MAKVLLIEDDTILLNMYKVKFTKAGHEVQTASNGVEGLELLKSFHPDIALMDLMMPQMDGFTALTHAKSDTQIKDIPIIILTNLSQIEDAQTTLKSGALDYIIKSDLTPLQVLEKVNAHLSNLSH
jgi:DNA-binding response OmpR family regulator